MYLKKVYSRVPRSVLVMMAIMMGVTMYAFFSLTVPEEYNIVTTGTQTTVTQTTGRLTTVVTTPEVKSTQPEKFAPWMPIEKRVLVNNPSGKQKLTGLEEGERWKPMNTEINRHDIAMDDPKIIRLIREKYLVPPSPREEPYNLAWNTDLERSAGQTEHIREILGKLNNGFFLECGAWDGEILSNSLGFERFNNWTGLLIEADPINYSELVVKHRKAYLLPACLSIKTYPMVVSFHQKNAFGKIEALAGGVHLADHVDVQCFPLYSVLLAINRTTIDYFSLDVEGNELDILETIPWDKVDIHTLSIEYSHGARTKEEMRNFMESKGYFLHMEENPQDYELEDFIFIKGGTEIHKYLNNLMNEVFEERGTRQKHPRKH